MSFEADVTINGAVLLGTEVVCDGFRFGAPFRIQTHIHADHLEDFATSKAYQDIIASAATRDLLIAEFNADLQYRSNLIGVDFGSWIELGDVGRLQLLSAGHMLGAAQVCLELKGGKRLGYSGDFQWPLDKSIQVDTLVVDSTYGSPGKIREYDQGTAEARLLDLVLSLLKRGPVFLSGHRGIIQRALQVLCGQVNAPIIASSKLLRQVSVYRRHGCVFDEVLVSDSAAGKAAASRGRYIKLYGKGERMPVEGQPSTITLSAFMSDPRDPVRGWDGGSYSVAMTDHADFNGTLEYVRATNASFVITDNTRGHGVELASEIRGRLGIRAVHSSNLSSGEWGM